MATLKRPVTPEEAAQYGYKDVTNTSPNNTPVTANQSTGYTYKPVQIYQPGMTLDSFNQQAQNQYMPAYNEKVNALKNALAQNLLALEGQKTGINRNYDMQSRNQNINTTKSKNNFSNTMLGRGLGRSTIAGTGLGEMDVINNRVQNDIEGFRTGDLGNIDAQMAQMQVGTNNQLTTMAGDLQTQIMALAQNLYDNYQNNMFKQESFNTGNQFDVEKYNNSNSQWQQSFDYGKSQDTQKQENWNKEYDLDKWYKEQVLAKDSGGNGNYKSPNGFGNDAQAKEYDQVLTTAKYIIGSNRPMANKLSDLESMITQAKAERNPSADALANQLQSMLNSLRMQASAQARSLIEKNAQIAPSTYKAPQPDAISGAAPIVKPYWKK